MKAIVTGADGALGRAVLQRLRKSDWRVAAIGRSRIDAEGQFTSGDLADETNVERVMAEAAGWLGGVDALVHLAGTFRWIETSGSTLADWRAMFDANLATAVATINAVRPHLSANPSIVLVGAQSAQPAAAGFGPYAAAKSGVARLVEALAHELAPQVRVNAVLPAIIDTPRNRADMPDRDPATWTSPEAIADTIAFLVSPQARAVTGAHLPVVNAA